MLKYNGIPFNKFISLILAFSNSIKVANQTRKVLKTTLFQIVVTITSKQI